jgi:hypothetical protein
MGANEFIEELRLIDSVHQCAKLEKIGREPPKTDVACSLPFVHKGKAVVHGVRRSMNVGERRIRRDVGALQAFREGQA